MMDYQAAQSVIKYLDFLQSVNGQIQQKVLTEAILKQIQTDESAVILDAGCGSGWLTEELKNKFTNVYGCDSSDLFIKFASHHHPGIEFKKADLGLSLPYPANFFDFVVMNMVGPDLKDLKSTFANIYEILKPEGKLIFTVPNPEFTFPAAEWHRSLADLLLMRKPKLIKKLPPKGGEAITREFGKNQTIESFYYTFENYRDAAIESRLQLTGTSNLQSPTDSNKFDLTYQLYRYPLITLLEFSKPSNIPINFLDRSEDLTK